MALSTRTVASKTVAARRVQTRAVVRPQAALQQQQKAKAVAGAIATVAIAAAAAAPAEAANVINTVASAAEGYPFVPPEWAPAVFTPLVGLVLPAIGMATLFVYIEKDAPQQ